MIAINDKVDFQPSSVSFDPEGRYIILVCTINKTAYTLINLYAPNAHQVHFIRKVLRLAKPLQKGHLLLCGDFNLVPDLYMDSTSAAKRRTSPLQNLISTHNLYDVWRCRERLHVFFFQIQLLLANQPIFVRQMGATKSIDLCDPHRPNLALH